jgi:Holliday junction resolvase-like predicted endonuclease
MSESTAPAAWWANPPKRALDCAQGHLERLGYRVLARQFRDCDLIAARWPLVIACEVRARRIIDVYLSSGGEYVALEHHPNAF